MKPLFSSRYLTPWSLWLLLVLVTGLAKGQSQEPERPLRVGIYENKPLVFTDEKGQPRGLYIDILSDVAQEQNWEIEWVRDDWPSLLRQLENGLIDLLVAIARSAEREQVYDFNRESVFVNWSQIYTREGAQVDGLDDLEGKTVAVVRGDIHYQAFRDLATRFDVQVRYQEVDSFQAALGRVSDGLADVAVVSRLVGHAEQDNYDVRQSSLTLNPINLYFAVPNGQNREILGAIDQYLSIQKAQPDSAYHRYLQRALSGLDYRTREVPVGVAVALGVVMLLLVAAILGNFILRRQIEKQTLAVSAKAEELEREIADRLKTEEAMKQSELYFRSILDHVKEAIMIIEEEGGIPKIRYVSPSFEDTFGYSREEAVGCPAFERIHQEDLPKLIDAESGTPTERSLSRTVELRVRHKNGGWRFVESTGSRLPPEAAIDGFLISMRDVTDRRLAEEAIQESEQRLNRQNEALVVFSQMRATNQEELDTVLRHITEEAAKALEARRVSIWLLRDKDGSLVCRDQYDLDSDVHSSGDVVSEAEYPPFLRAMQNQGRINTMVDNSDFLEGGIHDSYVFQKGALSTLNSGIRVAGTLIGYISCEQHDFTREWRRDEQNFSSAAAGATALLIAAVERERASHKLRESEEYFRALIENSTDVIAIINSEGRGVYYSPSLKRVFGYEPEELMGEVSLDRVHPEDVPSVKKAIYEVLTTPNKAIRLVYRERHKNGSWIWVEAIGSNLLQNPAVRGVVLNVTDITERRRAEASLRESEERFRTLVEHAPEGIMIVDREAGRIIDANQNMRALVGRGMGELTGIAPSELTPETQADGNSTAERVEEMLGLALQGKQAVFELLLRHKDGREIPCEARFVRLPGRGRELVRASFIDITERKKAQKVLEDYRKTLETEVEERTLQLQAKNRELEEALSKLQDAQDQLILSEKMASLGEMTAGIAHEIKNPLNFVNNFSELSKDLMQELKQFLEAASGTFEQETRDQIDQLLQDLDGNLTRIREHGSRADQIIRSMLLHSRGKSGEELPTELNVLADEYVKLAYHGLRAQDHQFNVKISDELDETIGELLLVPQDIGRVILNIVSNACQAAYEKKVSGDGEFTPEVRIKTSDLGNRVELRIRDNGNGIPPSVRDKVFNPFFTTKPAGKGTGLGLSICYDIVVREHKGDIRFETKEGEFTEFIVSLPRKTADSSDQKARTSSA